MWKAIYELMPWDYDGMDFVVSKAAMHICASNGSLGKDASISNFLTPDSYRDGRLSDEEFSALSDAEREHYIQRNAITKAQFGMLKESQQMEYSQRAANRMKKMI